MWLGPLERRGVLEAGFVLNTSAYQTPRSLERRVALRRLVHVAVLAALAVHGDLHGPPPCQIREMASRGRTQAAFCPEVLAIFIKKLQGPKD